MLIDLQLLPEGGTPLQGTYPTDIFGLGKDDRAKTDPENRCWYDVHASRVGDQIVLRGTVGAGFLLECSRCMETYRDEVILDEYTAEKAIEGRASIDLTDNIREDILLALPWYPRCDESPVAEYRCAGDQTITEANEPSSPEEAAAVEEVESAGSEGVWDALDGLDQS